MIHKIKTAFFLLFLYGMPSSPLPVLEKNEGKKHEKAPVFLAAESPFCCNEEARCSILPRFASLDCRFHPLSTTAVLSLLHAFFNI